MFGLEITVIPGPCYLHTRVSVVHDKADHIIVVRSTYM